MRLAAAAAAAAAAIAAPCARADDLSDLLDSAVALFTGGDGDVALHASVAASSDTDLNITAALTLVTGTGADLNVTVGLSADKCDTRNLQAAVAVDLISPDLVAQATCWLLSYGCDRVQVSTNLFQHTYSVAAAAPGGHGAGGGDLDPLQFVVDLYSAPAADGNATTSADDGHVGVQLVLADVQPMFTGLSFRAELHGVAAVVPAALLGDVDGNGASCAALDAALLSLGVAEEDLGLDEGALCSFLAGSAREMLGLLGDVGLTTDPVNLGRVVASLLVAEGEPPLPWLDAADGSVTLGQNSALCQVTPDPFRVTFSDLGGATLDTLLDGADDVVDALVAATNDCLSGDYAVTAANFEIDGAVELEPGDSGDAGGWALVGQLWGGGGKNPLGLFSCFADAFDGVASAFILPDGTPVTVDGVDVDGTDGECADDDEYAQCAGAVPPAGSGMQTPPPETEPPAAGATAGASADDAALTIGLAVCGTVVVVAVVVATAVFVARKSQLKQTRRVVRDALRAAQAPVVVAARVSGGGRGGSATSSHSVGVRGQGAVARPEDVDPAVVKAEAV